MVVCCAVIVSALPKSADWNSSLAFFGGYRDTQAFRERTAYYFESVSHLAVDSFMAGSYLDPSATRSHLEAAIRLVADEGDNLRYCIVDEDGLLVDKNIDGELSSIIGPDNMPVRLDGYDHGLYFDGNKVWVLDVGTPVDAERSDSGYKGLVSPPVRYSGETDNAVSARVLLAVGNVLMENPYGDSRYYLDQQSLPVFRVVLVTFFSLGCVLIAYGSTKRREKHAFDLRLGAWSGKIWLEVKALVSLLILFLAWIWTYDVVLGPRISPMFAVDWRIASVWGVTAVASLWVFAMIADLSTNGRRFFTHNALSSFLDWRYKHTSKSAWQKQALMSAYALVAAEVALILLSAALLWPIVWNRWAIVIALAVAGAAGIRLSCRYMRRYAQAVDDLGCFFEHVGRIKGGDMKTKMEAEEGSVIFRATQDLNSIQEGMDLAVREKTRSERMKVDLITNVSHDLKTPLTSIISYIDLLAKEEGLPEHTAGYVKVLAEKTGRLKDLIQDLFDLAKATSDDIILDLERIDLARLISQALADMEESIDESGLTFKVNLPDGPVHLVSDGARLYRVFQNLISNALKYSLAGSRVFVDLVPSGNEAVVTVKNTANYEMDFESDEILERFARGDRSRSTEGSGLGLAIAKSFTEVCGGRFNITIDGDLFKVELRFDTAGGMEVAERVDE